MLTQSCDVLTRSMDFHTGRRYKMFYRVAIRIDSTPIWRWESTVLSSLSTVIGFLRLSRALPPQNLLVCSSASLEGLQEQLEQEHQGLLSQAVAAEHFLQERGILLPEDVQRPNLHHEPTRRSSASRPAEADR